MAVILIAEDDHEINALVALTMRLDGYEVLQARDGAEAVEVAREKLPDLILMDVMMPRLSGYEAARTLHEDPQTTHVPIIFVTAKHETADRVTGLELAVDYVCKPFDMPELLARVRAALRTRKLQEELMASNEQLARLAITDQLTGLSNRRGFDTQFEEELWRAGRFNQSIVLLLFDLDHFKSVNDTWGHMQGDAVLRAFAGVLQNSSRRIDKVARFGGEEFAVLLPATDTAGALTFAEKVRASTEMLEVPNGVPDPSVPPIRITVSGGAGIAHGVRENGAHVAALANTLIQVADGCLYQAKETGRNRIVSREVEPTQVGAE